MWGTWRVIGLILIMLIAGIGAAHAQDHPSYQWPDEIHIKGSNVIPAGRSHLYLYILMRQYNICSDVLYNANQETITSWMNSLNDEDAIDDWIRKDPQRTGIRSLFIEPDDELIIPPHDDCYRKYYLPASGAYSYLSQPRINALKEKMNICYEEPGETTETYLGGQYIKQWVILIPIETLPCINEKGEHLRYYDTEGRKLWKPYYDKSWISLTTDDMESLPYCSGDLYTANPQLFDRVGYPAGALRANNVPVFLEGVRQCRKVDVEAGTGFDELSRRENVCIEELLNANVYRPIKPEGLSTLHIPLDAPPCYNSKGNRIGHKDRTFYYLVEGETLRTVAEKFNICLEDLIDANPFLYVRKAGGLVLQASTFVFVPDTPACGDGPMYHRVKGREAFNNISELFNVCSNRLEEANLFLAARFKDWTLPINSLVAIPHRPPCYEMVTRISHWNGISTWEMIRPIPYTCYREPIVFDKDYAGTEPPLSPDPDTDSGHCYQISNNTPVLYHNEWLTMYYSWNEDNYYTIAQCFGVPLETLLELNAHQYQERPVGSVVIPDDHTDCPLAHMSSEEYVTWFRARDPYVGEVNEKGTYIVDYNDTLSSIGRRYGYLPSMIAAENNLEVPYFIFPYQELQMPRMPSLYDIGKAMLYVGSVGVGLLAFVFGMYRIRRRTTKKKQKPTV